MRFLADQGASPLIVAALARAGHDAVHVRDLGMSRADDEEIVECADRDRRVNITEDVGFSALVVPTGRTSPSVILFRDHTARAAVRIRLLLDNLHGLEPALHSGAIVVLDDVSARVRGLGDPGDFA